MKPILEYPGAKWALARQFVQQFPRTDSYGEPYCGSGAVFFNLPWRPKHAILNDINGDIVNLLRTIREQGDALAKLVALTPWSREEYRASYAPVEEPLERARRFLVRTWQANSADISKTVGWRNVGPMGNASTVSLWRALPERILAVVDILMEAEIEHTNAIEFIQRYRYPHTLLYVDPPYPLSTRSQALYAHEMTDDDHSTLLDALDAHSGYIVLSGYACELYDTRLTHWHRIEVSAQAEKGNARTEVLWLNDKAANARQLSF